MKRPVFKLADRSFTIGFSGPKMFSGLFLVFQELEEHPIKVSCLETALVCKHEEIYGARNTPETFRAFFRDLISLSVSRPMPF